MLTPEQRALIEEGLRSCPCDGSLDGDCEAWGCRTILFLLTEIDRLKRGEFTEEEFQNLCHNLSTDDQERFKRGCEEYQKRLFGSDP